MLLTSLHTTLHGRRQRTLTDTTKSKFVPLSNPPLLVYFGFTPPSPLHTTARRSNDRLVASAVEFCERHAKTFDAPAGPPLEWELVAGQEVNYKFQSRGEPTEDGSRPFSVKVGEGCGVKGVCGSGGGWGWGVRRVRRVRRVSVFGHVWMRLAPARSEYVASEIVSNCCCCHPSLREVPDTRCDAESHCFVAKCVYLLVSGGVLTYPTAYLDDALLAS